MTAGTPQRPPYVPNPEQLARCFVEKFLHDGVMHRKPRLRQRFGYYTPEDHYECLVDNLLQPGMRWLDAGCGRRIFPINGVLAERLAARAALLVGVDPDQTIHSNPFIHERFQGRLEDYATAATFDLITLRMVAEHVEDPDTFCRTLARLSHHGTRVVVYTPNRTAPASIVARNTPLWFHYQVKKIAWKAQARDTFPVLYRMNSRTTLRALFEGKGFGEEYFAHLDDCRATHRFYHLNVIELSVRHVFKALSVTYPENCLLGVYVYRGQA